MPLETLDAVVGPEWGRALGMLNIGTLQVGSSTLHAFSLGDTIAHVSISFIAYVYYLKLIPVAAALFCNPSPVCVCRALWRARTCGRRSPSSRS
jgi:hypothetical protein